jgi:hypothetical protein
MGCLSDVEIQELADGEGGSDRLAHVKNCGTCAARLDERRRLMAVLAGSDPADVPSPALAARVRGAVHAQTRGATVLRPSPPASRRPLWVSLVGAAAVAVIVLFVMLPRVDAPATLSAAQIIDRSIDQMARGSGIETLEYELSIFPAYGPAGLFDGPYRIVQVFDRETPTRFTFSTFDRIGVRVAALAQDPVRGRRTELRRIDGRNYIVHVTSLAEPMLPVPQLLQAQAETVLRIVQLHAGEHLTIVGEGDSQRYVIELAAPAAAPPGAPLALERARVEIDGDDFRVREFSGAGLLLGVPFDVSFRLIRQSRASSVPADAWAIAEGPDDVVVAGEAAAGAPDAMAVVLRELGRLQGR